MLFLAVVIFFPISIFSKFRVKGYRSIYLQVLFLEIIIGQTAVMREVHTDNPFLLRGLEDHRVGNEHGHSSRNIKVCVSMHVHHAASAGKSFWPSILSKNSSVTRTNVSFFDVIANLVGKDQPPSQALVGKSRRSLRA